MAAWFISSCTLIFLSVGTTWAVLNATTLGEMKGRIEGLTWQNQRLTEDLRIAQSRYDTAQATRDDAISKKAIELSAGYKESMNALSARYENVLQENADLKNTLNALSSGERQQAAERKESRLKELSDAMALNSKQIEQEYRLLHETSASAGYERTSCEKEKEDKNVFSNVCEQASKHESEARSLREKISSLEKHGEILSGQMMALESQG
ncbi:hypothetical protein O3W44_21490 [Pantoea sp. LMR881]|uniref:hypothetical protein n=1 Tax=Pantoea sp. LMR881 TaxID=3014336 RepID=UPI0022AF5242|nr:hypothetical protein [Pantoea sp. LMR881]MCZ4061116.1 hypothetical protein [Pantoea sp. LMR881]